VATLGKRKETKNNNQLGPFYNVWHHPLVTANSKIVKGIRKKEENGSQLAVCYGESATAKLQGWGTATAFCLQQKTFLIASKFIIFCHFL